MSEMTSLVIIQIAFFTLLGTSFVCMCFEIRSEIKHKKTAPPLSEWKANTKDILLFFLALCFFSFLSVDVLSSIFEEKIISKSWASVLQMLAFHLSILIFIVGSLKFCQKLLPFPTFSPRVLEKKEAFQLGFWQYLASLFPIVCLGLLWTLILLAWVHFGYLEELPAAQQTVQQLHQEKSLWITALLAVEVILIAPISEELLFRGLLYRFFKKFNHPQLALWASAFIFALAHGNLLAFLPILFIGALLTRAYERTGNILVPICFHGLFNAQSFLLTLLLRYTDTPIMPS